MKFEAKSTVGAKMFFVLTAVVILLKFIEYFQYGSLSIENFYSSFALAVFFIFYSLLFNKRYSVIRINDGIVAYGDRGMVFGSFKTQDVTEVTNIIELGKPHISVTTKDDCRFKILAAGFSKTEVEEIIRCIKA